MKDKLCCLYSIKNIDNVKNNKTSEILINNNSMEIKHCTNELNSKIFPRNDNKDIPYFDMNKRENFLRYDPTTFVFSQLIVMYACKKDHEKVNILKKERLKYKMDRKYHESNIFDNLSNSL